jgi:hypothetical protein
MTAKLTAYQIGFLITAARSYRRKNLSKGDRAVMKKIADDAIEALMAEAVKYGSGPAPELEIDVEMLPPDVESYVIDFGDLKLPNY